jgi:hypothetical protein
MPGTDQEEIEQHLLKKCSRLAPVQRHNRRPGRTPPATKSAASIGSSIRNFEETTIPKTAPISQLPNPGPPHFTIGRKNP